MPVRHQLDRDGVALSVDDYGGTEQALLLLHGAAGHKGEWIATADRHATVMRVVVPDARGNGDSEIHPGDVSPEASAADVAFVIEHLGLAPAVLVGQSLGGQTAILVAAAYPELVAALVVAEAGPDPITDQDVRDLDEYLADRPPAEREAAVAVLRASVGHDLWPEWESISCPILAVTAGRTSFLGAGELERMSRSQPEMEVVEIAGAGHDLHLDSPDEWNAALTGFLQLGIYRAP